MFLIINGKPFPGGLKKGLVVPAVRVFAKRGKVAKSMGALLQNKLLGILKRIQWIHRIHRMHRIHRIPRMWWQDLRLGPPSSTCAGGQDYVS